MSKVTIERIKDTWKTEMDFEDLELEATLALLESIAKLQIEIFNLIRTYEN